MTKPYVVQLDKKQYYKNYYNDHKDDILKKRKTYYVSCKIERDNYHKNYVITNSDSIKEYQKEYQKDYQKDYQKKYQQNNIDKIRKYKREWARKKALEKNI